MHRTLGRGDRSKSPFSKGGFRGIFNRLSEIPPNPPLRKGGIKLPPMLTKRASFKIAAAFLMALILFHPFCPSADAAALAKSGQGDSKQPVPTALPLRTGDLYALVVGVSKYRDPKVPKLGLSDKDAKAFGDFLKSQNAIFKETRVTSLLNEKATKAEVEKYLYYTLPKAGKEDTIILFFSGHGAFDPIRPTEFLFLPYDAETEYLNTSGVKMSGLDFLKGVSAERVSSRLRRVLCGGLLGNEAQVNRAVGGSVSPGVPQLVGSGNNQFINRRTNLLGGSSTEEQRLHALSS